MMVAGIGARSAVGTHEVLAAIDRALDAHGLSRTALDAVATIPGKAGEPAIGAAASALSLPLLVPDEEALEHSRSQLLTRSPASERATGLGSVAEAAALAVSHGRLLGPRVIAGRVTCAIAEGSGRP